MRILIAEDDLTTRTMLTELMQRAGHSVIATTNGLEAWQILQRPDAPALALLDWMMPKMDGPEVVRLVRTVPSDQPPYLIMLTSRGEKTDIIEGLASGANDYLAKPFDAGELFARVEVGRRMVELQAAVATKVSELRAALEQIKTLRGIVPICASCKNIRDDKGYWNQVEIYVRDHTEARFSHGICPDCVIKLYPEYASVINEPDGEGSDELRHDSSSGA